MKIILVRHGETIENKKGIIQGQLIQGRLSSEGLKQVRKLANILKNEKIDFIYSSDLRRARETTKYISKFHPKTPIKFVKELREINLGKFQGKKQKEVGLKNKEILTSKERGGETLKDIFIRAKKFLNKILTKHKNQNILLVGHGDINKALICAIKRKPYKEILKMRNFKNTDIKTFKVNKKL